MTDADNLHRRWQDALLEMTGQAWEEVAQAQSLDEGDERAWVKGFSLGATIALAILSYSEQLFVLLGDERKPLRISEPSPFWEVGDDEDESSGMERLTERSLSTTGRRSAGSSWKPSCAASRTRNSSRRNRAIRAHNRSHGADPVQTSPGENR
jgi:hypothetical protein